MPVEEPCAVTILTPGKGGKGSYKFDEAALRRIVTRPDIAGKPVAVVSVAGAFRKGKSFLLNFFVHYLEWLESGSVGDDWFSQDTVLDKFHFRGGSERDTHGIQMWNHPFVLKQDNGKQIVVLLMDSQGTFDSRTTMRECATIFALSTLMSSLQIYNVSQNIQEDNLQHLLLFTEYGKLASQHGKKHKPFQTLMFLVRDWSSSFEYDYGFEGGKEFLDNKLQVTPGQAKELIMLRKDINYVFEEELECFLMPYPGQRVANNHKNKTVGELELDPDFEKHIKEFVPSVFRLYLQTKKIAGATICCSEILKYFKVYVNVFQGDSLPEPKSIYEATAKASLMTVVANATAIYDQAMNKVVHGPSPLADVETFTGLHQTHKKRAIEVFDQTPKLGSEELCENHLSSLQTYIDGRYHQFAKTVAEQQKLVEERTALEALQKKRQADIQKARAQLAARQRKQEEQARKKEIENQKAREDLKRRQKEQEEMERKKQVELQREREQLAEAQEEQERRQSAELDKRKREMEEENRRERERNARAMEERERQSRQCEMGRQQQDPFSQMMLLNLMQQMNLGGGGGGFGGAGGGYGGYGGGCYSPRGRSAPGPSPGPSTPLFQLAEFTLLYTSFQVVHGPPPLADVETFTGLHQTHKETKANCSRIMPTSEPRAVSVLTPSRGGKGSYDFDEDALRKIVGRPDIAGKPVAVVSVAGAFRKGKSFLLNFFVHYLEWLESGSDEEDWFSQDTVLDKFHFRGGSERDTHGIQMWNHPFVLEQEDGTQMVVLLMDTQGTFDSRTTVKECATIFALSTMISSLQIYNVSQNIQEDDLQHLQLFTEYGRLASQHGKKQKPFQTLMFLVRDWSNAFEYDYGFEGGKEFLDNKLKVTSGQAKELKTLRKEISNVFDDIECFLMPHPGLRVAKNHRDTTVGEVEEEFEDLIKEFVPSVFGPDLKTKKIAGTTICCSELVQYFKAYVDVFQGDSLPEPKSIFEATAEVALMTVVANAKAIYDQAISKAVHGPPPLGDVDTFAGLHNTYKKRAVQLFHQSPKLGDDELIAVHLTSLQKYMVARYYEFVKIVAEQQRLEDEKKALEEVEKKRQADIRREREQLAERQREQEETERKRQAEMQREREELARRQKEQEEMERKKQVELQKEREQLAERRKEQEEQAQRERVELDRQRREQEEENMRERETQRRQQERYDEERRQADQRQQEQQRSEMMRIQQMMQRQSYGSGGDAYDSGYASPSPAQRVYSAPSPVASDKYTPKLDSSGRWRSNGQFCKAPDSPSYSGGYDSGYSTPSSQRTYSAPSPSSSDKFTPKLDSNGRWRSNGRFCTAPE